MKILLGIVSSLAPSSVHIIDDLKPTADFLHLQQQLYQPIAANYATCFCYETLETRLPGGSSTIIVPQSSAVIAGLSNIWKFAINADHIGMAKYGSAVDESFCAFMPTLRSMADVAHERCKTRWVAYKGLPTPIWWTLFR